MKVSKMLRKNEVIEKAYECGFGDIGFTTADPFETQKELLQERYHDYEWAIKAGLDLMAGTDPKQILAPGQNHYCFNGGLF